MKAAPAEGPEKEGQRKRWCEDVATIPTANEEASQVLTQYSGPARY